MTTTYHGAIRDTKSGKFTPAGSPKDTTVVGIRIETDLKARLDKIPNKGEFLKDVIAKAVTDWENSHE